MRGHLEAPDFPEVRMRIPIELIRKQRLDPGSTEFPRRQADTVDDDHCRLGSIRSRIEVGAVTACRLLQQASGFVYGEKA